MTPEEWKRVNALFLDAIALPTAERAAFLDRECTHPGDRSRVESLLELHDRGSGFLDEGVGPLAADLLATPAYALAPGERLGPYRIVRPLDRGGMGVVYLGHDPRLDRPVAIKLLPPELGRDPRQRERLRREARAAASVSHAGVAHVYAYEEHERLGAYIVSEYVAGRTLRAEIAERPLPPGHAVWTARQIAEAVAAAHARQIVHRDLKPENVMRTEGGAIKVLDFGLALSLSTLAGEAVSRLTVTGTLLGTLAYMAPEQLRGEEAGPATDIFALGLVLHELASGTHAFAGSQPGSHLARVLERAPSPLPPEVRAAAPGLDLVVHRCLEKQPERRYASMGELAAALERIGGGGPAFGESPSRAGSGEGGRAMKTASSGLWWWQFHQVATSVFYGLTLVPLWLARSAFASEGWHTTLFVAAVAATALAASVRLHLVFAAARMGVSLLARARRRSRLLVRASDWLMSLLVLTGATVALMAGRPDLAALLMALAVCGTVAFLLIEPATASVAFPDEEAIEP